jgi:hypothetical protein
LFVVSGLIGSDHREAPHMEKATQLLIAGWIMGSVYRRVVLAEKFGTLRPGEPP